MRRILPALPLLLLMACSDTTLLKDLDAVATANLEAQKVAIRLQETGVITLAQAEPIVRLTVKVAIVHKDAVNVAHAAATGAGTRQKVISSIDPLLALIDNTLRTELVKIPNAGARDQIRNAIAGIRVSLTVIQALVR